MDAQREHRALLEILAKARKYARRGNGQGGVISKLAAAGLGLPAAEVKRRKRRVRNSRQLVMF